MIRALEVLYSLGIIDDDVKLTAPTGFQVAEIPLNQSYDLNSIRAEFENKIFLMLLRWSSGKKYAIPGRPLLLAYYDEAHNIGESQSNTGDNVYILKAQRQHLQKRKN
ncbi:hypothetical protein LIER_16961 [Lithospermum erythrorhizon]|uniref:Helicase associated domain-containing protein n=1 Tax=Lithospermum erythrorhizon TaxID=34254 RepID=A0AAV3QCY9_LITER